jgi:hypothetical protein
MSEGLPSSLDPPRLAHKAQRLEKQIRPSGPACGRFAGWVLIFTQTGAGFFTEK